MRIDYNKLTELDVSNNVMLSWLVANDNQLTDINVLGLTSLTTLFLGDNNLTYLDISKNEKLESLYAYHNQLTELDVRKNILLEDLSVYKNQLIKLDVSKNGKLELLNMRISGNPYSEVLFVYKNSIIYVTNQVKLPIHWNINNSTWTSEDTNIAIVDSEGLVSTFKSANVKIKSVVNAGYSYDILVLV